MTHTVRLELQQLTRAQLIALAVQKNVLPYRVAMKLGKDALVNALAAVEGTLTPVQA